MNRRLGETEMRRLNEFLSRAKRALEWGGSTPLFVARSQALEIKTNIRDREDACATQKFPCKPW
jgi:hypothetical protein